MSNEPQTPVTSQPQAYVITDAAIQPILNYLTKQPFYEVNSLLLGAQQGMTPFPPLVQQKEKPKEVKK